MILKNLIEIITFTNFGYLQFTQNLINSIKVNDLNENISVFCTDNSCFNKINSLGNKAYILNSDEKVSKKLLSWKSTDKQFGYMMIKKFESIFESLNRNDYVLYTDGDVVFKKNFSKQLVEEIDNNDFLFQLDYNPKTTLQNELCGGFMLIKSSTKTRELFNPKNLDLDYIINLPSHDQTYLNQKKEGFKYKYLDLNKFPNGAYYYNFICDPSIIHFNYVIGNSKKKIMKRYGEWYI